MKKAIFILILIFLSGCSFPLGSNEKIKPDDSLQLRATKDKILYVQEIDDIYCDEDKKCVNNGKIKQYWYVSDKKIEKEILEKDGKTYKEYKRTDRAVIWKIDKPGDMLGADSDEIYYTGYFYPNISFYQDNDEWYQIEDATTTIEAYEEQTATTTLGASGDPIYPSNNKTIYWNTTATWETAVTAATGTAVRALTGQNMYVQAYYTTVPTVERAFLTFDTSAIGSVSTISAASFNLKPYLVYVGSDLGNWGINVYSSNHADVITTDDFNTLGSTSTPFSDTKLIDDFTADTLATFTFNSSGLAGISKTGNTKIGMREVFFDANGNNPGTGNTAERVRFYSSEYEGTGNDPYLSVTWSEGGGTTAPNTSQIIYFE